MIIYQSRKKGGNGTVKVIDTEGNLKELPLSEYAFSGFEVQELDKKVKQPIEIPFLKSIPQRYGYPSTVYDWIIYGSFFTPETTITISGCNMIEREFIDDNQIRVKFNTGSTIAMRTITINNGVEVVFQKQIDVFEGVLYYFNNDNIISTTGLTVKDGYFYGQGEAHLFNIDVGSYFEMMDLNIRPDTHQYLEEIIIKRLDGSTYVKVDSQGDITIPDGTVINKSIRGYRLKCYGTNNLNFSHGSGSYAYNVDFNEPLQVWFKKIKDYGRTMTPAYVKIWDTE